MNRPNAAPMLVLVTGDPVEAAERAHGDFQAMIRRRARGTWPGPWLAVDARDPSRTPPAPEALAGLVVTGSPASVTEHAVWMLRAQDYLRRAVDAAVPLLGVCFGHQLLAEALGGRVARNPRGREIGTVTVTAHREHAWLGFARGRANATHVDSVLELPAQAESLATTELDDNAVVRFGPECLGVQFHPELDAPVMRLYVEARREPIVTEGLDPDGILAEIDDGQQGGDVLRRFLADVAGRRRGSEPLGERR